MTIGRLQIVWWWPEWKRVGVSRWPESWRQIYLWSLWLGFVEVRRWA